MEASFSLLFALISVALLWSSVFRVSSPEEKHRTFVYSLPKVGLTLEEDCFKDIYRDELQRDVDTLQHLGTRTLFLWCPWDTTVARQHGAFLDMMTSAQISIIITLQTDIFQIEQRSGERTFQQGLSILADELNAHPNVSVRGIYISYPLDGVTALFFFEFISKVRFWMDSLSLDLPLYVPWLENNDPTMTEQDFEAQLSQWDSGDFTAWVVQVFSVAELQTWITRITSGGQRTKQLYILYGADSYELASGARNETSQLQEIETLYNAIISLPTDNTTVIGSAILTFVDNYDLASGAQNVFGDQSETCPDPNPYLQTSCGQRVDAIDYGDAIVSVEMLGVFYFVESLMIERCLYPKLSAELIRSLWNSNSTRLPSSVCIFTISNPYPWWTVFIPVGLIVPAVVAIPLLCKFRSQTHPNTFVKSSTKKKTKQKFEVKIEKTVDDSLGSSTNKSISDEMSKNDNNGNETQRVEHSRGVTKQSSEKSHTLRPKES